MWGGKQPVQRAGSIDVVGGANRVRQLCETMAVRSDGDVVVARSPGNRLPTFMLGRPFWPFAALAAVAPVDPIDLFDLLRAEEQVLLQIFLKLRERLRERQLLAAFVARHNRRDALGE